MGAWPHPDAVETVGPHNTTGLALNMDKVKLSHVANGIPSTNITISHLLTLTFYPFASDYLKFSTYESFFGFTFDSFADCCSTYGLSGNW